MLGGMKSSCWGCWDSNDSNDTSGGINGPTWDGVNLEPITWAGSINGQTWDGVNIECQRKQRSIIFKKMEY